MSTLVIELNDVGLRVFRDGQLLAREPGLAVVEGRAIRFGRAAAEISRLKPRETIDKHWHDLNQDPLVTSNRGVGSHADLAYMQLEEIVSRLELSGDAILAVHGGYSTEQLSLILGLMQPQSVRPVGLVDAAVAATAAQWGPGQYRHIDITRHSVVTTDIDVGDDVVRHTVSVNREFGVRRLVDLIAEAYASEFLSQSRLDPLHQAESEQLLFHALPTWIAEIVEDAEHTVELSYHDRRYQAHVERSALREKIAPLITEVVDNKRSERTAIVSHRFARWCRIVSDKHTMPEVPDAALAVACNKLASSILAEPPALPLVTRVPAIVKDPKNEAATVVPSASSNAPSYVVIADHVWPLSARPLYVSADGSVQAEAGDATLFHVTRRADGAVVLEGGRGITRQGVALTSDDTIAIGDRLRLPDSPIECHFVHKGLMTDPGDVA